MSRKYTFNAHKARPSPKANTASRPVMGSTSRCTNCGRQPKAARMKANGMKERSRLKSPARIWASGKASGGTAMLFNTPAFSTRAPSTWPVEVEKKAQNTNPLSAKTG